MEKFEVGIRLGKYKGIPATKEEYELLEKHNVNNEFEAVSVGNSEGQVAIFPTDDFGEEKAWENARAFAKLLNDKIKP